MSFTVQSSGAKTDLRTLPMKVGLLGGTFDPPHNGHLHIAREAQKALRLDQVIFIPNGNPPHKPRSHSRASAAQRCEMLKLAVSHHHSFSVSDIETSGSGKSYTIDTLRQLHSDAKDKAEFYFLLGDDCAANLHIWKSHRELLELASFVSIPRFHSLPDESIREQVGTLKIEIMQISSSMIREKIARGDSICDYLSADVRRFIVDNELYKINEQPR